MAETKNIFYDYIKLKDTNRKTIVELSDDGFVRIGGNGKNGKLWINSQTGEPILFFDSERVTIRSKQITIQNEASESTLFIDDTGSIRINNEVIELNHNGKIKVGGKNKDGSLFLKDKQGKIRIHLSAITGSLAIGGNDMAGKLFLLPSNKDHDELGEISREASIYLDGSHGDIGCLRDIIIGNDRILLKGNLGDIRLGGNGVDGDILIYPSEANNAHIDREATIKFKGGNADIYIGGNGQAGDIYLFSPGTENGETRDSTVHIDGLNGDIKLSGADCAENFEVSEKELMPPGSVLVVDQFEKLRLCDRPYDKRVVGIVSGAGNNKPGVILNNDPSVDNSVPLALSGKVYCKVDAVYGPIETGDLLTTSASPGCAMKVDDPQRAFGAVLGKALRSHNDGIGLIPVLVGLF